MKRGLLTSKESGNLTYKFDETNAHLKMYYAKDDSTWSSTCRGKRALTVDMLSTGNFVLIFPDKSSLELDFCDFAHLLQAGHLLKLFNKTWFSEYTHYRRMSRVRSKSKKIKA